MAAHSAGQAARGRSPRTRPARPQRHPGAVRRRAAARRAGDDFLAGRAAPSAGWTRSRRGAADGRSTRCELLSGRRARLRRAARRAPPARASSRCRCERPEHARAGGGDPRASCSARATTSSCTRSPAGERGKFENLDRLLARAPGRGPRLAARDRRRRGAAARLPRPLRVPLRALLAGARPARPPAATRTRPGRSRGGVRAASCARPSFVEIGPVTAFARRHVPGPAAVPAAAHGLGPGRALGGARARARLALRRRRRRRDRATCAAPAAAAYAREAARGRGARVPRRAAPTCSAREAARTLDDAPALVSEPARRGPRVAVVAEFYPSRRDPVLGIWAHRQALAARDAGADVRVLVLHRARAPARGARGRDPASAARDAARSCSREPRTPGARRPADHLRPLRLPAARARLPRAGAAWAAPPLALALRRLRALVPVRADPRPQRGAGRRRRPPRAARARR